MYVLLVVRAYIWENTNVLQLQKISICLNRGREESMDDYYILRAEATSIFFLQLKLVRSTFCSAAHTAKM